MKIIIDAIIVRGMITIAPRLLLTLFLGVCVTAIGVLGLSGVLQWSIYLEAILLVVAGILIVLIGTGRHVVMDS